MNRTDIAIDIIKNYKTIYNYNNIKILESNINNYLYHTIKYNNLENNNLLIKILSKEIYKFINKYNNINKILLIGLGNINYTSDSIGPKIIKKININNNKYNISCIIPDVLANTGIKTYKIIKSITKEIKPDLVILIDSLITNNINNLNKVIEISNNGLIPGSGLFNNNIKIDNKLLKTNIITIGIPTSLEYKNNNNLYLVTTPNIDYYIDKLSNIISTSLNNIFKN